MKMFLLFYMCHFVMGLTHCYKTTGFFTFIFAVFILNLLYDFPADIFSLAMNDAVWDVQHTAYITIIRWNVTIYNGRPWWKDWWNFKSYQVPVYEYILSYWVNLEWLAIWSRWQIHIMAHQAVKSASKLTNCEHFEYQMWLTNCTLLLQHVAPVIRH